MPPHLRLAARVENVRQRLAVHRTVVIVPDVSSYVAAISRWTLLVRYPVLIDNGTWESQQDISRFVRAFAPQTVVRWKATAEAALPADAGARRAAIENAAAKSWGVERAGLLAEQYKKLQLSPPGVVVAWPEDPAWTAALALAAGHGQPIIWAAPPRGGLNDDAESSAVDSLSAAIEKGCQTSGYTWRALGDEIDAVALCLNLPAKVIPPPLAGMPADRNARLATTDLVGRPLIGQRSPRWGWASQVHGNEAQAAYRAMSALYLMPSRAWVFDGYEEGPPWKTFDGGDAAKELQRVNLVVQLNDGNAQSAAAWQKFAFGRAKGSNLGDDDAARGGTDAGLILVNTMGNGEFFDLRPGRCFGGDVPLLSRPSIVYFVHSWSALAPAARHTIGARFLEHGAYAYLGSVNEPFLQAFVPTPIFARRFAAQIPWAAAVRLDSGPPWKIAAFGDPLMTFGPPAPAATGVLPLDGARNVSDDLTESLKSRRFHEALRELSMLGRDADGAKLVASVSQDDPDAITPDVARAGILSVYFAGRFDLVPRLYAKIAPEADRNPALRDILWHTLGATLSTLRDEEIRLLRDNLRPDQIAHDAAMLARAVRTTQGENSAMTQALLSALRAKIPAASIQQFEAELAQ